MGVVVGKGLAWCGGELGWVGLGGYGWLVD